MPDHWEAGSSIKKAIVMMNATNKIEESK
jgi:hypothetical protein